MWKRLSYIFRLFVAFLIWKFCFVTSAIPVKDGWDSFMQIPVPDCVTDLCRLCSAEKSSKFYLNYFTMTYFKCMHIVII